MAKEITKAGLQSRHKGAESKRLYRLVDFKQNKLNVPANVFSIEYDPNRSTRIARIHYKDGSVAYILAPHNLKVGDTVVFGDKVALKPGNRMKLKNIIQGTPVPAVG